MKFPVQCCLLFLLTITYSQAADRLVFEAKDGGDSVKHVVLIAGDEEYRTEESMPMLGKILPTASNITWKSKQSRTLKGMPAL